VADNRRRLRIVVGVASAVIAVIAFKTCASIRPGSVSDYAKATASSSPPVISFPAANLNTPGIPRLSEEQAGEVKAVLSASSPEERSRLIVSLVRSEGGEPALKLFFGDPRYPDGIIPPGGDSSKAFSDHTPISTVGAYHAIGEPCNIVYQPSNGELIAGPGDALCGGSTPSPADRALLAFRARRLRR
jgi:hypothetical protein